MHTSESWKRLSPVRQQSFAERFCFGQMPECPVVECLCSGRGQPRSGLGEKFGVSVISELLKKAVWAWNKLFFYWEERASLLGEMALCHQVRMATE